MPPPRPPDPIPRPPRGERRSAAARRVALRTSLPVSARPGPQPPDPNPRPLPARAAWLAQPPFWLVLILASTLLLWHPAADAIAIYLDDLDLLEGSRQLSAGRWDQLLAPQDVHLVPLFRLVRLYFDLRYPERYAWLYWLAAAAHLASVGLLFALCRRFLATRLGALAAAALFAWHMAWGPSIYVKAHFTYILSFPFLLGALYYLCRLGEDLQARWAAGAFLCLAAAVGLHSMFAACAIPGVLTGYYLLARPRAGRRPDRAAWLAAGLPFLLAAALWLYGCARPFADKYLNNTWPSPAELLARTWGALAGVLLHFSFQLWPWIPGPALAILAALAGAGLLFLLRRQPSSAWLLTAGLIAALPVFGALLLRGQGFYRDHRFLYQGFLPLAVAAGAAVDAACQGCRNNARLRAALPLTVVLAAAAVYAWQRNSAIDLHSRFWLRVDGDRPLLLGWASFLDQAAARARASSRVFRLPALRIYFGLSARDFLAACHPRGLPGVVALSPEETRPDDCRAFWDEVREVRRNPSPFERVPLPDSLPIVSQADTPATGSIPLACIVPAA